MERRRVNQEDDDHVKKKQRIENRQDNNTRYIQFPFLAACRETWPYEFSNWSIQPAASRYEEEEEEEEEEEVDGWKFRPSLINFFESGRHKEVVGWDYLQRPPPTLLDFFDDSKFSQETGENLLFCLPSDAIEFIAKKFLNPLDYLNFRSISKSCSRLLAPRDYNKDLPLSPWLMIPDNAASTYRFLDSELGGVYLAKIPNFLSGATIANMNHGWLLVIDSLSTLVFYNPLTTKSIKLTELMPDLTRGTSRVGFSSSPTSSKCIVALFTPFYGTTLVDIFRIQKNKWDSYRFDNNDGYMHGFSNKFPVFYDGAFYVYLDDGSLGVLDVKDDQPISWNVIVFEQDYFPYLCDNYLLECAGKLLLVSVGKYEFIVVRALNRNTMSWEKVSSFANHTVYISARASFSTPARVDWMRNTIFFQSLLAERVVVYYSMDTGIYNTIISNNDDVMEHENASRLMNSGWIHPSWS